MGDTRFERCIRCGKITNILKSLHIDFRDCYIEGGGQLCPECYYKLLHMDIEDIK